MKQGSVIIASILLFAISIATSVYAQWQPLGLQGGSFSALFVNGGYVFAGDDLGGGIYRSSDSGATWIQVNTGLSDKNIVVLGGNGSEIFAATDTAGIFVSSNNGNNWMPLAGWKSKDTIRQFTFLGTSIFIATRNSGIFQSTDNSVSWTAINNGLTSLKIIGLISDGTNLFANTFDARIFRSSDNGNSWINASQGLPEQGTNAITYDRINLFAVNEYGLYTSTNFGRNWSNPHPVDTTFIYRNDASQKATVYSIISTDSGIIVGTAAGVYRTIDLGIHWLRPPNKNSDVGYLGTSVHFLTSIGPIVIAGIPSGVSRSQDYGVNWAQNSSDVHPFGPGSSHAVNCITRIGSNLFAGLNNAGFVHTSDGGVNWIPSNGLSNNKVNAFTNIGQNLFVGTDTAGIFISTDNGLDWTELQGMTNSYPVNSLIVSNSTIFAGTIGGGVYRSIDIGKTWSPVNKGLKSLRIYALFISGNILLSGSESDGISRSTNMGGTWDSVGYGGIVDAFTILGTNFFAGTHSQYDDRAGKLYRSSDSGITWRLDSSVYPEYGPVFSLAAKDSNVFAGSHHDIHIPNSTFERSFDGGSSWIGGDEGLRGDPVYSLSIIGDTIYAGTANGVWFRPLSEFPTTYGRINAQSNSYFGEIKIGDTVCNTIEIHNTGNSSFTLEKSFTVSGDSNNFSINKNQLPAIIKAGDSLGISICFYPVDVTNYFAYITWQTDIASEFRGLGNNNTQLIGTGVLNSDVRTSSSENVISLSPNPTTGILTTYNAPANIQHVTISSILGENVLELSRPIGPEFTLDLSKLPSGTYFARFALPNEVIIRKIVKE